MRKIQTIRRATWEHLITSITDGDVQDKLQAELQVWRYGKLCEYVECSTDVYGRIDSMSSPRPGNEILLGM